jgi:hypothetical protein
MSAITRFVFLVVAVAAVGAAPAAETIGSGESMFTPLLDHAGQSLAGLLGIDGGGSSSADPSSRKLLNAQAIDATCTCGGAYVSVL